MVDLKEIINLEKNKLIFIGGRPSTGKTSIILDITKDVALNEKIPVVVFSLETGIKKCVDLILGENGTLDYMKELSKVNIFIDDTPVISVNEIREKSIRLKNEKNIGLIIIDYLQLIKTNDNENVYVSLKELSQELDVPVIVTSQLTAEIDKREDKKPNLDDIKDIIKVNSDVVMFLYNKDNNREIIVAKNRYGNLGTFKL